VSKQLDQLSRNWNLRPPKGYPEIPASPIPIVFSSLVSVDQVVVVVLVVVVVVFVFVDRRQSALANELSSSSTWS